MWGPGGACGRGDSRADGDRDAAWCRYRCRAGCARPSGPAVPAAGPLAAPDHPPAYAIDQIKSGPVCDGVVTVQPNRAAAIPGSPLVGALRMVTVRLGP